MSRFYLLCGDPLPMHFFGGWREPALKMRNDALVYARDSLSRGDRAKAARHVKDARVAHRAALLGLLRRAA